jgi:hypothetical protein
VNIVLRGIVNDLDIRVGDQLFVAGIGFWNVKGAGLFLRGGKARARYPHHVHKSQPPHCINMEATREAKPHNAHANAFHCAASAEFESGHLSTLVLLPTVSKIRHLRAKNGALSFLSE